MTAVCALCGALGALHAHHLTRRSCPDAPYLDSVLTITLCPRCHVGAGGIHAALRCIGLDWPPAGMPAMAYRLSTVAVHAGIIADAGRPFVLLPGSARGLGALLREASGLVVARGAA